MSNACQKVFATCTAACSTDLPTFSWFGDSWGACERTEQDQTHRPYDRTMQSCTAHAIEHCSIMAFGAEHVVHLLVSMVLSVSPHAL